MERILVSWQKRKGPTIPKSLVNFSYWFTLCDVSRVRQCLPLVQILSSSRRCCLDSSGSRLPHSFINLQSLLDVSAKVLFAKHYSERCCIFKRHASTLTLIRHHLVRTHVSTVLSRSWNTTPISFKSRTKLTGCAASPIKHVLPFCQYS